MKLRNLFMAVIAGAAMLLTGCNKEVDLGPAQLTVSETELVFSEADGSQFLTLLATRDWVVSGIPNDNWLGIQESGKADVNEQQILVTVAENTGSNRTANLIFTIGYARVNVKIIQNGPEGEISTGNGTLDDPFTIPGVIAYIDENNGTGPRKVFIKGIVSDITSSKMEQYSVEHGNGTFMISDDGSLVGPQFQAYRALYLGNKNFVSGDTELKVGDEVILYGSVYLFKDTYETVQKEAFLYSLNGVDRGGVDITPPAGDIEDATIAAFIQTASADTYYRLTGTVSDFSRGTNSQGKKWMQFNLTDDTGTILVYGFKDGQLEEWADKLEAAKTGTAVITGTYEFYAQKQQHEVMKATIESFTEGGGLPEEDATGDGSEANPYNPKAAYDAASALEPNALSEEVYIQGIISSIKYTFSAQYGTATFNISKDGKTTGTQQFTCYGVKYLGNRNWVEGDTQIAVGDQVVVCAKLTNYQGEGSTSTTPETANGEGYLVSLTSGGTPTPQPGDADGLTPETAFNAEQAYDWVVSNLAAGADTGEQKYYVKGKVTKFYQRSGVDQNFANNSYHQASFYMNDVEGKDFEAYQINYLGGATWAEGDTDVAEGDEVVIYGPLKHYVASSGAVIAETTSAGTAYLYSLNGKTAGGDTPDPGPGGDADFSKAITIKLDNTIDWAASTDNTYGAGFAATYSGIQVAIGKFESTTTLVQPDQNGTKVYKKAVITITAPADRKIVGVRFKASDFSSGQYCKPLTVVEPAGGGTLNADTSTWMIGDWTGSATKVAFQALEAQARLLEAYVVLDGEGGDTPGPEPGTGNDGLTPETAFTVAEAIAKAQEVGMIGTDKEYYVRGFVYRSVDYTHDATFEMMGSSIQELFTIFRTKSFGGADWTGQEPIGWGDDVIVKGKILTMYGATPVLANGTLIAWNDKTSWDGEEPQPDPEPDYETNLSNINSAADNTAVKFIGTVMGVSTNSFVVSDGSANVYVFKPASMAAAGDIVKVEGTKTTYGGVPEIAQGATVTIDGSVRDLVYPNPFDITSTFDSYTSGSIDFISFTGTLAKSGNYYNVNVDGATAHVGSISSPIEGLGLNDMNGKIVTFTGYYVGFSGNKYVNMLCVNAQEAGDTPAEIQSITIVEFLRKADHETTYRLSGTASNVYSYYGQTDEQVLTFDLTDDTGTVSVNSFAEGEVAKWFEKVPEGSTVTLTGKYS